jgi:hypothetical protein
MAEGLRYAFFDLLGGIGVWLLVGIILAGAITAFLPPAFIERYLGSGLQSMVMMLVIAVPLYVCATGSTPIAAALALKGLSPGAALVFLLAGPATNAASLLVVAKILGKRATVIYLTVIVVVSLFLGLLTNYVYGLLGLDVAQWIQASHGESASRVDGVLAVVLLLLIGFNLIRVHLYRGTSSCGSAAVAIAPMPQPSNIKK